MLVAVIVINVLGQLLMKMGINELKPLDFHDGAVLEVLRIFSNKYVLFGISAYAIGTFFWLYVLSKMELSLSYPILSSSYVLIAILSWIIFGESMSWTKIAGIGVICTGIYILNI
jgi:multidrug transporter EmrE-like cation transporter